MIRFLKRFYEVRSLILWDLVKQEKSVPKTFVFDTLNYEQILLACTAAQTTNVIIAFL